MTNNLPSQRQLKVGETVRHALSDVFMREDIYNPTTYSEINITVSEVRISPDLRNATVFVMPLGGSNQEETVAVINQMAPQLRHPQNACSSNACPSYSSSWMIALTAQAT